MGQRKKTFELFARTGAKTAKRLLLLLPVATLLLVSLIFLIVGIVKGEWNWIATVGVVTSLLVSIGLLKD